MAKIKNYVLHLLIFSLVLIIGCNSSPSISDNNTQAPVQQNSPTMNTPTPGNPVPTEPVSEQYTETREPIIYITPSDFAISPEVSNAVNKCLFELETDYSVKFLTLDSMDYINNLSTYLASGSQCDILYTGMPLDYGYDTLIKQGSLEAFNDYLDTENGKILKESIPEDCWFALERNGKIYGIDGYPWSICSPPSYTINTELMHKYGLSKSDFNKPLNELYGIFDIVKKGEGDDFYPLTATLAFKLSNERRINNAVTVNRDTMTAGLLIDNPQYQEILKALWSMYENGYISPIQTDESVKNVDNFLVYFSFSTSFPYSLPSMGAMRKGDKTATSEDIMTIPLNDYGWFSQNSTSCTAVSALSTKKDYAFDFLTKVYTDTKLTDLLLFGIDGKNYNTTDGIIPISEFTKEGGLDLNRWLAFGNSFISTPIEYEYSNKRDLYFDFHNQARLSSLSNFIFDESGMQDIISKTNKCMDELKNIFKDDNTYDSIIESVRQNLYSSGVQTLIDEVNSQLNDFISFTP